MTTVMAKDGRVIAVVGMNIDVLVNKLTRMPERPRFRFSQDKRQATMTVKDETSADKVLEALHTEYDELVDING